MPPQLRAQRNIRAVSETASDVLAVDNMIQPGQYHHDSTEMQILIHRFYIRTQSISKAYSRDDGQACGHRYTRTSHARQGEN
jgi:hypothetical protein